MFPRFPALGVGGDLISSPANVYIFHKNNDPNSIVSLLYFLCDVCLKVKSKKVTERKSDVSVLHTDGNKARE